MVPGLQWFDSWYFDFTVVRKWYTFSRNCALNFEFGPFPGLAVHLTFSHDAARWQWASAPRQPHAHGWGGGWGGGCTTDALQCAVLPVILDIVFCVSASHHMSCFWWEEEEGNYSWDETQDNCPNEGWFASMFKVGWAMRFGRLVY